MLRKSWLTSLRALLFGSVHRFPACSRRRSSVRPPRPNLEALEDRLVLSATVQGFTLDNNGNLYNPSGAQIDSSVVKYTVANNTVIDLHANHALESMNSDGSAKVTLGTNAHTFVVAGNGDLIWLDTTGNVYDQYNPRVGGDSYWIATNITSMAIAGNGDVMLLNSAGNVYDQYNPRVGGDSVLIDTGITSMAIAGNGDVMLLTRSGQIYDQYNPRVVGAFNPLTFYSNNWSGYVVDVQSGLVAKSGFTPQMNVVNAVSGTWTVPAVSGTGTAYSSIWVGIDGVLSSTNTGGCLEQVGTEEDIVNGQPQYYAWTEMLPQQPKAQPIPLSNLTIHAGDSITASVDLLGSSPTSKTFQLTIVDNTTGQGYTITQTTAAAAPAESAEWIVEAPSIGNAVQPLANFGKATFSAASATINGIAGCLGTPAWVTTPENLGGGYPDTTSLIGPHGGFSVFYGTPAAVPTNAATSQASVHPGTSASLLGVTAGPSSTAVAGSPQTTQNHPSASPVQQTTLSDAVFSAGGLHAAQTVQTQGEDGACQNNDQESSDLMSFDIQVRQHFHGRGRDRLGWRPSSEPAIAQTQL